MFLLLLHLHLGFLDQSFASSQRLRRADSLWVVRAQDLPAQLHAVAEQRLRVRELRNAGVEADQGDLVAEGGVVEAHSVLLLERDEFLHCAETNSDSDSVRVTVECSTYRKAIR